MKDTDQLSNQSITRKQTFKRMVNIVNIQFETGIVNTRLTKTRWQGNTIPVHTLNPNGVRFDISNFNFLFRCTHCKAALFCPYHISWTSSFPLRYTGKCNLQVPAGNMSAVHNPSLRWNMIQIQGPSPRVLEECFCVVVKPTQSTTTTTTPPTHTNTHAFFHFPFHKNLYTQIAYLCILMSVYSCRFR